MATDTVPENASELDATHDSMEADKFTASFIWVTPELAKRWLAKNERNRASNKTTTDLYARDMDAGNWEFTGEAVKFSNDGRLLDGQHRLAAICKHGKPILMLVVRGLSQRAQDVMDSGRKRSAADMFTIADKANASLLAATTRLAIAWTEGKITTSDSQFFGQISKSQIRDFEDTDPTLTWAVRLASARRGDIPANPAAIGFSAWLMGQSDAVATTEFFSALADMRTDGAGDPRYTVLKRLNVARTQRERLTSVQQSFYLVKAWNAWRRGSTLKTIKASTAAGPQEFPRAI